MSILVVGQGYVGLPLTLTLAENHFNVYGYDIDSDKIENLNNLKSNITSLSSKKIQSKLNKNLFFINELNNVADIDVVFICVPTPLDQNRQPDLSQLQSAIKSICSIIDKKVLIIVESTIAPGTMRNLVLPLVIRLKNWEVNDFDLVYSPERIDPDNKDWNIYNTPKLVAGYTSSSRDRAIELYKVFVEKVVPCDSFEVAESAKLLENSFRFINISFINEFSIFCDKLGISSREVISAASSKPYGFMTFFPSVGVGGHCIPVDPIYLLTKAQEIGIKLQMIEIADSINQQIPRYYVMRAKEILIDLKDKKVLVMGIAYKPNVADIRESPSISLIQNLRKNGAEVLWHDDIVKTWNGEHSSQTNHNFDLVIIATKHDYFDMSNLSHLKILQANDVTR
jgi:UDP-N-acetyl-D-glucosamine dehydrogenase